MTTDLKSFPMDHLLGIITHKVKALGHADASANVTAMQDHYVCAGGIHFLIRRQGGRKPPLRVLSSTVARTQDIEKATDAAAAFIDEYLKERTRSRLLEASKKEGVALLQQTLADIEATLGAQPIFVEAGRGAEAPCLVYRYGNLIQDGRLRLPRDPEKALLAIKVLLKAKEEVRTHWQQALSLVKSLTEGPNET
jgi:hypothetical protein